eukprot:CCRYP_018425-RA/>CCRYP_018425-RA protein AED:0.28 eAED:0.28 QI:0/-1/0/1/-1/1/1/0/162
MEYSRYRTILTEELVIVTDKRQEKSAVDKTIILTGEHVDDVYETYGNAGGEVDWWKERMFNNVKGHLDELIEEDRAVVRNWKGSNTEQDSRIQVNEGSSTQDKREHDTQTDVDLITKKLAANYTYYGPGFGKSNFPGLEDLGSSLRGKKHRGRKKRNRSHHK